MSYDKTVIVSPILEKTYGKMQKDIDCLMRALVLGDMTYLTRNNLIEKIYRNTELGNSFAIIAENTVEKAGYKKL